MVNTGVVKKSLFYTLNSDGSLTNLSPNSHLNENKDNLEIYDELLRRSLNSIEISNADTSEISYDKFKELFFKLPFLPDLFRSMISFIQPLSSKLVKSISNVKVSIFSLTDHLLIVCFPSRK